MLCFGCQATGPLRSSRSLLPTKLALFSRLLQLPIPLGVEADVVVVVHVSAHHTPSIIERPRRSGPDALVGRGSDVGHARNPNEFLEVFGNELRAVVGDDLGLRLRVNFLGVAAALAPPAPRR